jgi:hypothetical protein
MKLNRTALKFCGLYIVFVILLIGLAYFSGDAKGRVILVQMAMMPAGILLLTLPHLLGFTDHLIQVDSWMNSVFFFFPMSLVAMYLIGWAFSGMSQLQDWYDKTGSVDEEEPNGRGR